ncbi:hypothetical protein F2Q69_00000706 [Brassica cretica]|uniref:Exportin-1/Importin-beta-like domain-containing protein n=1 Tax=Brassica cretica TaxID=69181 RepID=A0A8S9PH66_BRACR|nr:hypothetical protein F2Q69_00000706 [Brassica cretica]
MTQQKIKELKQSLNSEFKLIHELCLYVLSASQRQDLIRSTLSALHAYLSWIPLGYIFESPLLETLLKFFPVPAYRNLTLQCLTEVAALNFGDFYNVQYVKMYTIFIGQLQTILPPSTNIPEAYSSGSGEEQDIDRGDGLLLVSISPRGFQRRRLGETVSISSRGYRQRRWSLTVSISPRGYRQRRWGETVSISPKGFRQRRWGETVGDGVIRFREDLHREHARRRFRFRRITAMAIESPTSSKQEEEVENENTEHEFPFL